MKHRILVINPNSTSSMTRSLEQMFAEDTLGSKYDLTFVNPASGPMSINNDEDGQQSLSHCQDMLVQRDLLSTQDAFLVACYSSHPLVTWLCNQPRILQIQKLVLGIFEASVIASLESLRGNERFGIVSTGKVWEQLLSDGVSQMSTTDGLEDASAKFAGVCTTGLNATDLHDMPADEVQGRLKQAVKSLVKTRDVGAICLGCAGMTGMDLTVREALREELGAGGDRIKIVDGVCEGVRLLGERLDSTKG